MCPTSIGKAYAIQGLITTTATIFAVAVLFGSTKNMPFEEATLIVCPTLYLMSFISVYGLKEVKSSQPDEALAVGQETDSFWKSICL